MAYVSELTFGLVLLLLSIALWVAARLGREALAVLIVLCTVCTNLFVSKGTVLFGLVTTAAEGYAVAATLGLNLFQELYGKAGAQKMVLIALFSMLLFVLIGQLHLLFVPIAADGSQVHFAAILVHQPRIIVASVITYIVVQFLDIKFFGFLRRSFGGVSFGVRAFIATFVLQLVDTVMFSFLGLWGIVSPLTHVIIMSMIIKSIAVICETGIIARLKAVGRHGIF